MKAIMKAYILYSFDELNEDAKNKAINDEVSAGLELAQDGDMYWEAANKAEKMHTPWFAGEIAFDENKEIILSNLREQGDTFLLDGSFFVQ
jgi:hypothetical protein